MMTMRIAYVAAGWLAAKAVYDLARMDWLTAGAVLIAAGLIVRAAETDWVTWWSWWHR